MQDTALKVGGFSLDWLRVLVFAGAALGTLVASVMADEQNQRLRNGAFGTVAGGFVGALMALLTKQDDLVVIGFFGSTVGAFLGWLISLTLSFVAAKTQVGRTVLEYQIGGWQPCFNLGKDATQGMISGIQRRFTTVHKFNGASRCFVALIASIALRRTPIQGVCST